MNRDGTDKPLDVYPVGVLAAARTAYRASRLGHPKSAWHRLLGEWRHLRYRIARRNWRAIRNSFNGYLAEHDGHPHNAGRGWTRRAAIRRVERICRTTGR